MTNLTENQLCNVFPLRKEFEDGEASLKIELIEGAIKVWHGSIDDWLLGQKIKTTPGDWEQLLISLEEIGIKWRNEYE